MADEQVYVGEEGAKELYRRVKAIVPAVDDSLDISSGNAISNRAVTEALGMVTSFVKADGIGPDKHPDVENPSGRVIYLVHDELAPNPDQYKEWIWSTPPEEESRWECIGDTSTHGNSWKTWSEERGSTGTEDSVYIGSGTTTGSHETIAVGHGNTIDSESHNSSVFGRGNSVTVGTANSVVGADNNVTGSSHDVFGSQNTVSAFGSVVVGNGNVSSGNDNTLIGSNNSNGENGYGFNAIMGRYNKVDTGTPGTRETGFSSIVGGQNTVQGAFQSTVLGESNKVKDIYQSQVVGQLNDVKDSQFTSVGGYNDKVSDANQVSVFGYSNVVDKGNGNGAVYETVVGNTNVVHGESNAVFGVGSIVTGNRNMVASRGSNVSGDSNSVIQGGMEGTTVRGERNIVSGGMNGIGGNYNIVSSLMSNITGDHNIALGERASVTRDNTVTVGESNSATVTDETDYSGTDVVEIGTSNTATNAANAYQLGRENTVTGNNLANKEQYPHSMAMNLGRNNRIAGEGVNLGKDNVSDNFGINIGQGNSAHNAAIVMGEDNEADHGSLALGKRAVELYNSEYPSLEINGKFYPIVVSSIPASPYVYTYRIGIDKDGAVQDISNYYDGRSHYSVLYNSITQKILVNEVDRTYLPFTDSRTAYGYTDDEGNFIETQVQPDPEHPIQQYDVYTFDDPENPGTSVTFVATWFVHTPDPMVPGGHHTDYRAKVYYELKLGGIYDRDFLIDKKMWYPAVYSRDDSGAIWVDESNNRAVRCTSSSYSSNAYAPKHTIMVTGFDKDGTFYPYNGSNNDGATLYQKEFPTEQVVRHVYGGDEYEVLGIKPLDEYLTWIPADNNSIAVGDAQQVMAKSVGISSASALIKMPPAYYDYSYRYRDLTLSGEGAEYYQTPVLNAHNHVDSWPTPDSTPILDSVELGSIGIFNGAGPSNSPSRIRLSSIGIGTENTADGASIAIGKSTSAYWNSYTFGSGGLYSTENSVAIGMNGISAQYGSVRLGMNSGTAYSGSVAVGFNNVNATNGSLVFGNNSSAATNGSITVGTDNAQTYNGSFLMGRSSYIQGGSFGFGSELYAEYGAFVVGRNSRAENGGITIANSGSSVVTYRSAGGSIIKFRNPDNVYVPITGGLFIKPGYRISKVRSGPTCTYDGKQCRIVDGHYEDDGYYNSGSIVDLYDESGTFVASVTRTNEMNASYYGSTYEYWMVYDENTGKYTFVSASYDNPAYGETSNIEALKTYLLVECSTFHKDGQLYVYANGFNYPDTDLSTEYVDVASCTFNTYDYWTYEMLGYEREAWHRLTDIGGYDQGIAIGRDAHSQGSSLSLGTNNGNSSGGSTIEIENAISARSDNFPTYVGIRVKSNYTHANGYSIAMGFNGVTAEGSSMVLGYDMVRAYNHSLSIGYYTNVADECSMAIGRNSNSATDNSFAVGDNGNYAEHSAFAVGTSGNRACGNSVSLGYSNISNDMSVAIGKYSTAETYSTSFGDSAYSYHYGMAIGQYAKAMDYSIALGKYSSAYSYSVSIGDSIYAYNYSVNVGREGRAGNRSVSVGYGNSAFHYSVALGRDNNAGGYPSIETDSNAESIAIGTQNYAYSYGVSIGRGNTAYGKTVSIGINNYMNYPDASPFGTLLGDSNYMQSGGYNLGIGYQNIVGYESIAIGRNNYSYNWSIMMGFNNSANQNAGAHATIIGYGNYNNTFLEYLEKDGSNYETNSIILGSHNSAYHHNSILIGCGNTTAASQETSPYTDDDGFMLAIGYKNYVGRNYDIAIGYKSYAYGGENVALQNSYINGFHNFAFNQSNIYNGISNVAMNQSTLGCPGIDSRDGVTYNRYVTNNMLLHSTFNISDSATMASGFTGNLLLESVVNCANRSNNVNFNLIYMGGQDNPLYLENGYFYNNIIFGTRRSNLAGLQSDDAYTTVLRGSIGRSLFINSYTQIEDATEENCQDNLISNSSIKIPHIESMQGITCIDSTMDIAGPVHILDSVLLAKSRLYLRMDNNRYPFQKNLIIDSLVTDFSVSEGDGVDDYNQVSGNLVMGTRLHGSYACFSFSDHHDSFYNYYKPVITTEYEATISKSRRIFNFGDNSTFSSANVFSAGLGNRISDAEGCFIYGKENVLSGFQTGQFNGRSIQNIYIIGTENASYYYNDSNVRTGIDIRSIQTNNGPNTYGIVPATVTLGYRYYYDKERRTVTRVSSGYYLYDGDVISEFDSTKAAKYNIPIVQITPSEFNTQLAAHTLIGNTIYNFTTSGSISQLYQGEVLYPDKRYNVILETYTSIWDPQRYAGVIHESETINFQADRAEQQFWCFMLGDNNRVNAENATHNYLIGANNAISKNQIDDDNAGKMYYHQILDKLLTRESFKFSPVAEYELPYGRLTAIYSREYLYSYGCLKEVSDGIVEQSMTGETLYNRFNAGTLEEGKIYKSTSFYSCPQPIPGFITVDTRENYSFDGVEQKITYMETKYSRHSKYGARNVHGNFVFGNDNAIHENIMNSMLIGSGNELINSNNDVNAYGYVDGISNVFVQGNNNVAKSGSNIISMGNGNISVGHNSVAIGSQLISSQWQTVIGKYNTPIAGPNRLESENPNDSTKAIFIIGNGYSTEDGVDWQDESLITRSNAMVVYADGTVTAKKFISSEPEITLVPGNGISFSDNAVDNTRTIAVTQEIADFLAFLGTRPATGEYTINSIDGVLSWAPISTRTV